MPTEKAREKKKKKRAQKRKHERLAEGRTEEAARSRRNRREGTVAIALLVAFVPFMVAGVLWWPHDASSQEADRGTGLPDGSYSATYLESRPATGGGTASAALDVDGEVYLVTEGDLEGGAADSSGEFFEGRRGQSIEITATGGRIYSWAPARQ